MSCSQVGPVSPAVHCRECDPYADTVGTCTKCGWESYLDSAGFCNPCSNGFEVEHKDTTGPKHRHRWSKWEESHGWYRYCRCGATQTASSDPREIGT